MMADFNSLNDSLHWCHRESGTPDFLYPCTEFTSEYGTPPRTRFPSELCMSTYEYGSWFSLRRSSNCFEESGTSRAIPPVDEKTSGSEHASLHFSDSLTIFLFLCSFMGSEKRHKFLVSIRGGARVKNVRQTRPPVLYSRNLWP